MMGNVYLEKPWLKNYDRHVPPSLTYEPITFCKKFKETVSRYPDKPAVIYLGKPLTFRDIDVASNQLAACLKKNGAKPGSVIGLNMPNVPAHYIAVVAVQKADCISTGLSPLLTPKELVHQINDSNMQIVLTLDMLYDKIFEAAPQTKLKYVMVTSVADFLPPIKAFLGKLLKKIPQVEVRPISGVRVERFLDAIRSMPKAHIESGKGIDEPMYMMYTGGTTGPAKGALLTQRNVMSNAQQIYVWVDANPSETFLCAFPLFHIAGLCLGGVSLAYGITQVAVPNPRDTAFLIEAIKKYKPTALVNVTTIYLELMKKPEFRALDFSGVNWFMSAAQPFPPDNIKEFESIIGPDKLIELYGMTETSPVTCCLPRHGKKKPGSIGMPMPDTIFQLIDPETGSAVKIGDPGEIVIGGPQVFTLGYYNQPEETAHALRNGWMYTGDIARMDDDGYFYIVDRLKDMVIVSGFKVFTRELDDVLTEHPDIEMAASFGVPDPERAGSERVASVVVLKSGIEKSDAEREKITAYLKERVAAYKVPKRIIFMDQLPLSGVGKVLKRELRKMVQKGEGT
jgi:acyl-CoA synthetase (AMP-forming)/AMP-acid ligase II